MSDMLINADNIMDYIDLIRKPITESFDIFASKMPGGKIINVMINLPTTTGKTLIKIQGSDKTGWKAVADGLSDVIIEMTIEAVLRSAIIGLGTVVGFTSVTLAGAIVVGVIGAGIMIWKGDAMVGFVKDFGTGLYESIGDITSFLTGDYDINLEDIWDTFINNDGVIDANDTQFYLLKLWTDADGDGVVDEGELISLSDAGIEFLRPLEIKSHNIEPYYCDAMCPWQKGGCENTNRRLRRWLPRNIDITKIKQEDLDTIAKEINNIPRKSIGYRTPAEFYESPPEWCTSR